MEKKEQEEKERERKRKRAENARRCYAKKKAIEERRRMAQQKLQNGAVACHSRAVVPSSVFAGLSPVLALETRLLWSAIRDNPIRDITRTVRVRLIIY